MERRERDELIAAELERTPHGSANSPENYYRAAYVMARQSSLGPKGEVPNSPHAAHDIALRLVRRDHPDFDLPV